MSAWGVGIAENDDAADWLSELADSGSLDSVIEALEDVADAEDGEYLEVPEGSNAVVAAAVLADLLDAESPSETERFELPLARWRTALQRRGPAAVRLLGETALEALQRVRDEDDSELRQLWGGADDLQAWSDELERLRRRIERHLPAASAGS
jgi:hypothetical protein